MNTLALQVRAKALGVIRMPGRYSASEGVKAIWSRFCGLMGQAMSLYLKRLEAGKFIWPVSRSGDAVQISAAQPGYLLDGEEGSENSPGDCFPRRKTGATRAGRNTLQRRVELRSQPGFSWAFPNRHGRFRPCRMPPPNSRNCALNWPP